MTEQKKQFVAYLFLFLSQITVGINIVASKALIKHMSPELILCARFAIGSVFLFACHYMFAKPERKNVRNQLKQLTKRDWTFLLAQGLSAGALFNIFMLFGLNFATASVAGIVTSSLPALVLVFSMIFLKLRPGIYSYSCIGLAICGLVVLNLHNFHRGDLSGMLGMLLFFIAMLPEAAYYILAKIYHHKLPIFLAAAILNAVSIPVLIIVAFVMGHQVWPSGNIHDLLLLVTIGISGGVFYVFWGVGCKSVSSTAAGLFTAFMPVATLAIAWIFLGETISWLQSFGMLLVLASIGFNGLGSYFRRLKSKVAKRRAK